MVENPINLDRKNETITLSVALLQSIFPNQKMNFIQIKDLKTKEIVTTQSVDYDGNGIIEEFLIQSNFQLNESKEFQISIVSKPQDFHSKVYASFIESKEGMQDFAWENDFIGYRFYGQERANIQGTGLAMDIWCKRVPDFLTDKWYTAGQSYHKDTGYGADHYNSGKNQGCGGSGILKNDSIYFSKSFYDFKIIENGPIRVVFELKFKDWSFDQNIIETKRITLDAGHFLNKIESSYNVDVEALGYKHAVSFVQRKDSDSQIEKDLGWFSCWESLGETKGNLGTAFIGLPNYLISITNRNNHLVSVIQPKAKSISTYYAGAAWDVFGAIHSKKDWFLFIKNNASCIENPCIIKIVK